MSLYPITVVQPETAANIGNIIMQGCMTVIPFNLDEGGAIVFSLVQAALVEDFSIRAWFSTVPNGAALGPVDATQVFSLLRLPYEIVVYDPAIPPPPPLIATVNQSFFPIEPGALYLNLLNLINRPNIFTFAMNVIS